MVVLHRDGYGGGMKRVHLLGLLAVTACAGRNDRDPVATGSSDSAADDEAADPSTPPGDDSIDGGSSDGVSDPTMDLPGEDPGPPGPDVVPEREPFTIIMVPDTQYTVQNWPNDYFAQMDWIVGNRDALNIRFVTHVGDLQETAYRIVDWNNAVEGLDTLQGNVPYTIAIGNHDFDAWADGGDPNENIETDRSTSTFNEYVPKSRVAAAYTFGDSYPDGSNDNSFHTLAAGGTDFLILTLKYRPIEEELAWGRSVVEAHPDHLVIIVTHEYLSRTEGPSADGQRVWDGLAKLYPNVWMVLSGHLTGENRRVSMGDHGNSVIEILADFQSTTNREANSYLRIMEMDPVGGTIEVQTYSPAFDKYLTGDVPITCPPWECPVTGGHDFVLTEIDFPVAHAEWITTRDGGECLDVDGGSTANAASVQPWECNGRANQQWRIRDAGEGYVHVVSRLSNKCLNVEGTSPEDGVPVIQWTCGPDHNSMWTVEDVEGGYVRFVVRQSGKCLTRATSPTDGTPSFVQATCSESTAQHFVRTAF